jgi:hypothetical protein
VQWNIHLKGGGILRRIKVAVTGGEILGGKFDVFISYYSDTGRDFAKALKEALQKNGWRAFFAETDIRAGQVWEDRIMRALSDADYFILLYTPGAEKRAWVKREYYHAFRLGKTIIPCIRISGEDTLRRIYNEIEDAFPGISGIQAITWESPSQLTSDVIEELKRPQREKERPEYLSSVDPYSRGSTSILYEGVGTVGTPLSQSNIQVDVSQIGDLALTHLRAGNLKEGLKYLIKLKGCAGRHERKLESIIDQVKSAIKEGIRLGEDSIAEIEILINEIKLDGECIKQ